jgi:mRNA-degrading endonuclease RelE of RelBE toxin-antitoxin system
VKLRFTNAFARAYAKLTAGEQAQVDRALQRLLANAGYPSLQARKWGGGLWYARASQDLRFFYEVGDEYYLLRDVGHHDIERAH